MIKYTGTSTLESMTQAKFYNRWTLNKFTKFLNGSILEIGCGIGTFSETLSKYGKITAIDVDNDLIEIAKKNNNSDIKVGYGDIEKGKYFFNNKRFETIVCINVLEHIDDDERAIRNMYDLLAKNGVLILLIPSHPILYGEIDRTIGHFRRYSKEDIINKLNQDNFSIVEFKTINFIGALGWFISGKILKNKEVDSSKIKLFNLFAPIFLKAEDLISPPFGTSFLIIASKT